MALAFDSTWHKASSCANADCVEVRRTNNGVQIRDSKDPDGPALSFTADEWCAFVSSVTAKEFDLA
jgi:Domain of unknown function (DUF397)